MLLFPCSKDKDDNSIVGKWNAKYYQDSIEINGQIQDSTRLFNTVEDRKSYFFTSTNTAKIESYDSNKKALGESKYKFWVKVNINIVLLLTN